MHFLFYCMRKGMALNHHSNFYCPTLLDNLGKVLTLNTEKNVFETIKCDKNSTVFVEFNVWHKISV